MMIVLLSGEPCFEKMFRDPSTPESLEMDDTEFWRLWCTTFGKEDDYNIHEDPVVARLPVVL